MPLALDSLAVDSTLVDTLPDGSLVLLDSLSSDSLSPVLPASSRLGVALSKDSLEAPVDYTAKDSMVYDIANQRVYLYGEAEIKYTSITLRAASIVFDWKTNIVTATGMPDSLGRPAGVPQFEDDGQSFVADSMRYNFTTRRGIVYDVVTEQTDVVIRSQLSKFITQEARDTSEEETNIIYSSNSIFTTCTHDHPHFGIRSQKQKVVPDKLVIIGPSNLEIMDVPTPLWLPFGFFPIPSGRSTGLLFPRDYQYSPQWGFGFEGIGWYFPLGDNFNLSVTGDVYLRNRVGVNVLSQYRKRYKYNGNFNLGYNIQGTEDEAGKVNRERSYIFRWSHQQDRSAHPTINFGGAIDIQTNSYQQRVFNDQRVLDNQLRSNLNFSKNWRDKPINFTASFNHNQNSNTGDVTVSFPNLQFQTQAINPFKKKARVGPPKWYEDITFRYNAEVRNRFQANDSTLFTQKTLDDAQFGMQQRMSTGTSFKVLRYFNLNPSVNYDEVWYLRTLRREFDPTQLELDTLEDGGRVTFDTLAYGEIVDRQVGGFEAYRQFNASIALNTQIFGTMRFGQGWLRGLRHVAKPSLSLGYTPDYTRPELGYFRDVRNPRTLDEFTNYSIFDGGIFGAPPSSQQQMGLNYSLNNIFEAKYFSKKDSTEKNLKLFDNIIMAGNYNFAADSLQWSIVSFSGTTRMFKGMTTVSLRAAFDPYQLDEDNRRINKLMWEEERKLLRFDQANARFNTNITVGKLRALIFGEEERVPDPQPQQQQQQGFGMQDEMLDENRPQRVEETDFLSLFENFRISHNFSLDWLGMREGGDTLFVGTNTINCSGNIQMTSNWFIRIGNFGYDFVRKGITYPSVGFSRDLHCWEAGADWQPLRGTYSFFIRVKPGSMDFLNIPYNRTNADARARL